MNGKGLEWRAQGKDSDLKALQITALEKRMLYSNKIP